jgi:hypothetical protein
MKVITVKSYEFDELSDKAKETAREWWRSEMMSDNSFSECVIDEAVEQGTLMGIEFKEQSHRNQKGEPLPGSPCVWWSGFSSQGDGACFEGLWYASEVKADKVAEGWGESERTTEIKRIAAAFAEVAKKYPGGYFSVKQSGHYSHEFCTEFNFEPGEVDYANPVLDAYRKPEDEGEQGERDDLALDRWREDFPEDTLKEAARDLMRYIYERLEEAYDCEMSDECVDENIRANEYLFTEKGSRSIVL